MDWLIASDLCSAVSGSGESLLWENGVDFDASRLGDRIFRMDSSPDSIWTALLHLTPHIWYCSSNKHQIWSDPGPGLKDRGREEEKLLLSYAERILDLWLMELDRFNVQRIFRGFKKTNFSIKTPERERKKPWTCLFECLAATPTPRHLVEHILHRMFSYQ